MKNILIVIISVIVFGKISAQDASSDLFTFNHLALSVEDIDRSVDFYKDILGLREIVNRTKMEGIRWFSLGEDKELHLISTLKENVTVNKAVHMALATSAFHAFISKLEANKITYSDWPGTTGKVHIRADGIKQIFFQDPDGYWIEVNSVGGKE